MLHGITLPYCGGSPNLLYGCLKLILTSNIYCIYVQSMLTRIRFFITELFFSKLYIKFTIYMCLLHSKFSNA